jgi:hypothetical protein
LREMHVLVVPHLLADTLAAVLCSHPRASNFASILARLPDSRFRSHLRVPPTRAPRQLPLF